MMRLGVECLSYPLPGCDVRDVDIAPTVSQVVLQGDEPSIGRQTRQRMVTSCLCRNRRESAHDVPPSVEHLEGGAERWCGPPAFDQHIARYAETPGVTGD